jgi:hypothetical protein
MGERALAQTRPSVPLYNCVNPSGWEGNPGRQ